ncbi:hypothetical protein K9N68_33955 (plasmid) [Kovacikia minuta CCNUW1]|uniref:hypothetical protein n=1 Tax=Kovacikia minuta TaxID=2931930 RepID=UPI001CCA316B|nr:hypothetical protein [Kovacikia minuta]UBF30232.1 hypothetical protein K9N68_33955 [Kovacikia minuta CCNUW1]
MSLVNLKVLAMRVFKLLPRFGLFEAFIALLFSIGFFSRLAPLFNQDGRLMRQPTEDGFLMLTIARNIALGLGMSTADGTIPTNGTQPLFTLIQALAFALVGANKERGVALILAIQIGISMVTAILLFLLTRQVLKHRNHAWEIAALAATLWFSSPVVLRHTMNFLETGIYFALILASVSIWYRLEIRYTSKNSVSWSFIGVGVLLGLTTWARIDAVFLVFSISLWHSLLGLRKPFNQLPRRLLESITIGLTAALVISPWLLFNKLNFGSFMPISGTAQSYTSSFASNAIEVPAQLFEYLTFVLPLPHAIQHHPLVLLFTSLTIFSYLALLAFRSQRFFPNERIFLFVALSYAALLVIYYGFFFGAAHFVNRYLAPISLFTVISSAAFVGSAFSWLSKPRFTLRLLPATGALLLCLILFSNARNYLDSKHHGHFQVVDWVSHNVDPNTWVGAIQTGTLGFFHNRTINLDGKVNPAALHASIHNQLPDYIINQSFDPSGNKIQFLADWSGIAQWHNIPSIRSHFQLLLNDPSINLAVLKRTH